MKFLYMKKQKLKEQLYKIHLECAASRQNTWYLIQISIDSKLQQQMEKHYIHLDKKLDHLHVKQRKQTRTSYSNPQNNNSTPE
jgi:hypothetical protein